MSYYDDLSAAEDHRKLNGPRDWDQFELDGELWQFSELRKFVWKMGNVCIDLCNGASSCWRVTTSGYLAKSIEPICTNVALNSTK